MKPIHIAALLGLGALWGASFFFIGIAVHAFGPLVLMFLRVLLGGALLACVAALTRREASDQGGLQLRSRWRQYLLIGLLNSALPFTLIALSKLSLPVGLTAVLNSTTPLFTALIAALWGHEMLRGRTLLGGLLGVLGVTVLVNGSPLALTPELLIAVLASLLAACCYGAGTVYASRHISGLSPIIASCVQLLSAAIILAGPAALSVPSALPTSGAVMGLLALVLLSTACAYLLYFFLLQQVGPTRTSSVTFLVPVFGSLWGVLFLQEAFTLGMLGGMAIIMLSVGLVLNTRRQRPPGLRVATGAGKL